MRLYRLDLFEVKQCEAKCKRASAVTLNNMLLKSI